MYLIWYLIAIIWYFLDFCTSVFIFQFCDVAQVAIAHNYIAKFGDMKNIKLKNF